MENFSRRLNHRHPEDDNEKEKVFVINNHEYCLQNPSNEAVSLKSVRDIEEEINIKETFEEG